jgi:hypothetical protein
MAIDVVVEEVADNLEEIAQATRRINTNSVSFFLGGAVVGLAVGFWWGHRHNKEKLRAEAFKQSEEEVAKIREVYQQKTVAATPKPSVEEVIEERGYERPLPAPVPLHDEPVVLERKKDGGWDWQKEIEGRSEGEPYIIHQDEFMSNEKDYDQAVYTYYEGDDVLVEVTTEQPLPHADLIVGVDNLKFGYGTDSDDVVFVRNDSRELEMEICLDRGRYDEKVLGLDADDDDDDDED